MLHEANITYAYRLRCIVKEVGNQRENSRATIITKAASIVLKNLLTFYIKKSTCFLELTMALKN